jgi:hypothetical protein
MLICWQFLVLWVWLEQLRLLRGKYASLCASCTGMVNCHARANRWWCFRSSFLCAARAANQWMCKTLCTVLIVLQSPTKYIETFTESVTVQSFRLKVVRVAIFRSADCSSWLSHSSQLTELASSFVNLRSVVFSAFFDNSSILVSCSESAWIFWCLRLKWSLEWQF